MHKRFFIFFYCLLTRSCVRCYFIKEYAELKFYFFNVLSLGFVFLYVSVVVKHPLRHIHPISHPVEKLSYAG